MKFKARCEYVAGNNGIIKWMLTIFPESHWQPEHLLGNTVRERGEEIIEGKIYKVIIEPDDEA
jgi:hypothetical protein